jgi:hypothetical protein
LSLDDWSKTHFPGRYIPEEYYECRLPVYAGFRFRKFSVPEIMRLGDLDIRPHRGQLSITGVIMEQYASGRKEPRRFRKEEFERMISAGIILPEENAQLIDGYILVPGRAMTEAEVEAYWRKLGGNS